MRWNAKIIEQGNGLPDAGAYVPGNDGQLYKIVAIENNINTSGLGQGNWCRAVVALADWSDVDDAEIFPALARV